MRAKAMRVPEATLYEYRVALFATQRQAAHALRVSLTTYGAWERGRRDPPRTRYRRLALVFHLPPQLIAALFAPSRPGDA